MSFLCRRGRIGLLVRIARIAQDRGGSATLQMRWDKNALVWLHTQNPAVTFRPCSVSLALVIVLYLTSTLSILPVRGCFPMLEISELSKTYANGVHALKNVSLQIPNGMFGLLGPNGAGKSTLMRTIATLQDPDHGSIRLNGLDVLADKPAARRVLGYLPQEFGVYPKVTAEAMLDHFAVLKGIVARGERKAVVESLLRQVNLWDVRKRKLGTYSGGMRQRFGIAQAL